MSNLLNNLYDFGSFRFDGGKLKLWKNNELILLSPKASELLNLLLERNGDFVSKEEIFRLVWADTFVEDGVLTQNVYTLRKTLGNNEFGQPLIENRTKRGYRITVSIQLAENSNDLHKSLSPNGKEILIVAPKIHTQNIPREVIEGDSPKKISGNQSKSRKKSIAVFAVCVILLLAVGFFGYRFFRPNIASFFRKPIETVKFQPLSNTGDLTNAVISPDGNFAALIKGNNVYLKDIASTRDIKLEIPQIESFSSLQFSPDGNFLYFRNHRVPNTQAKIFKVPRFGGDPALVTERVWGSFSVSPDGKMIAYFRNAPPFSVINLLIRNLETGEEREFPSVKPPNSLCLTCSPAWSSDGEKVAFVIHNPSATSQLFVVNLTNNKSEEFKIPKLKRFEQIAWFPDGDSFIISASDGGRFMQLWKVFYPDGEVQPMTNGLVSYGKVSISNDGKKILVLQTTENSNIFVANIANLAEQKQLTTGNSNDYGQISFNWLDDRKLIFSSQSEQKAAENLWTVDTVDGSKRQLTNDTEHPAKLPASDGKFIYFNSNKTGFANIYQMNMDGGNIRQLTNGVEEQRQSVKVSPDGNWLYYNFRSKESSQIRRFNLQTQTEEIFFNNSEYQPGPFLELSPDGKYLTFTRLANRQDNPNNDKLNAQLIVVSTENINEIKTIMASIIPPTRRFSPDNNSLDYISSENDGIQIVRRGFDGSEPKVIYTIPNGRIFNFAWSKDGKQLALSQGQQLKDAVLLTNFE